MNSTTKNQFNGWAGYDGRGGYHGRGGHGGNQIELGLRPESTPIPRSRSSSYNYILEKVSKQPKPDPPQNSSALKDLKTVYASRQASSDLRHY